MTFTSKSVIYVLSFKRDNVFFFFFIINRELHKNMICSKRFGSLKAHVLIVVRYGKICDSLISCS